MKNRLTSLLTIILIGGIGVISAQGYDDDDIYYNPSKDKAKAKTEKQAKANNTAGNYYIYEQTPDYPAADTYSVGNGTNIDVDAYNRRGIFAQADTTATGSTDQGNFANTRKIEKFYNPDVVAQSSVEGVENYYYADNNEPTNINIIVTTPDYWGYPYYGSGWYWNYWGYPRSSWYWNSWCYNPWSWNYWGWDPYWSWTWGWGPGWGHGWHYGWGHGWDYGWGHGPAMAHRPGGGAIGNVRHGYRGSSVGNVRPSYRTSGNSVRRGSVGRGSWNQSATDNNYRPGNNSSGYRQGRGSSTSGYRQGSGSTRSNNSGNSYSRPSTRSGGDSGSFRSSGGSRSSGSFGGGGNYGGGSRGGGGGGRGRH